MEEGIRSYILQERETALLDVYKRQALVEEAKAEYQKPEVQKFFVTSSEIEHDGYCQWPRLKETMVFCKRMGYKKIGLGFCIGFAKEARIVADLFRNEGFTDVYKRQEYGQRCRNGNLEDMDVDRWRRVSAALGIPTSGKLAPVLERFHKAAQRQPLYQCMFHEDDGSLTESYGLMFE